MLARRDTHNVVIPGDIQSEDSLLKGGVVYTVEIIDFTAYKDYFLTLN